MKTDLVNSFLNRSPYHLPFDVQLTNHMRQCRFLDSFNWLEYWQDVVLWFALTIQHTTEYGITETWFQFEPGFGFKLILMDDQNNVFVRNVFREYKNAPRGLSDSEYEEFSYQNDDRKWSLKEYLITSREIKELKSSDSMINKVSIGSEDRFNYGFREADFGMAFENSTSRKQYDLSQPYKNFFRHHNYGTTDEFLDKIDRLIDYHHQFWGSHRDYATEYEEPYHLVEYHAAFLHGSLLAFRCITLLMPEVIQVTKDSWINIIIRLKDDSINLDRLPTVVSISNSLNDEERKEVMGQFSTRSSLHGRSAFVWPFRSYGVMHTRGIVVETTYKPDVNEDVLKLDWLLNALDSIWPVNVQAPVNQFDEISDSFYLSRYVAGLLCSKSFPSQITIKHKVEHFNDHQSNQFLLSSTADGNSSLQIILQIDEYLEPVKEVEQTDGQGEGSTPIVKIDQYMNQDRVLRRKVIRLPSSSSNDEEQQHPNGFVEMGRFFDLSSLQHCVHDHDFQSKISDAMSKCFGSVGTLLNGRHEVKAFVNGAFHYFDAISLDNNFVSKTLATQRQQRHTELVTFNFLTEYDVPLLPSYSTEYDQKIVNVVHRKPYSVEVIDVGAFLENEIDLLRMDSWNMNSS